MGNLRYLLYMITISIDVISYIRKCFPFTKEIYPNVFRREVGSALAYQSILRRHRI